MGWIREGSLCLAVVHVAVEVLGLVSLVDRPAALVVSRCHFFEYLIERLPLLIHIVHIEAWVYVIINKFLSGLSSRLLRGE